MIPDKLSTRHFLTVFLIVILFSTRKFLFTEGHILWGEFLSSTDYSFWLTEFKKPWTDYTSLGHSNLGFPESYGYAGFGVITPFSYVLWLFFMSFFQSMLGAMVYKIYILFILILPFIGMYSLVKYYYSNSDNLINPYAFLSALVYSINPQVSDRIVAGTLRYNLAYGLFPLLILFTIKAIENTSFYRRLAYSLLSAFIISFSFQIMPHFVIMYTIPILGYLLFFSKSFKKSILTLLIIFFLSGGLIFILILPGIFYSSMYPYYPDPYHSLGSLYYSTRFSNIWNVLRLNVSIDGNTLFKDSSEGIVAFLRLIIPLSVLSTCIFIEKTRKIYFPCFLVIVGFILTLGNNPPLGFLYEYLYRYTFIFKPFRDPTKFLVIYLLGFSLLVPYFLNAWKKILNFKEFIILVFVYVILLLLTNPVFFSGNFGEVIVPFQLPLKYSRLSQELSNDKKNYRVSFVPFETSFRDYKWYEGTVKPTGRSSVFDGIVPFSKNLATPHPNLYTYSQRYLNYLHLNLPAPWAINRLAGEGVKYLIVDKDVKDSQSFINQFDNSNLLQQVYFPHEFTAYELKNYKPIGPSNRKVIYYYGTKSPLPYLNTSYDVVDLSVAEIPNIKNIDSQIFLYNYSLDDLYLDTLDDYSLNFFPDVKFQKSSFLPAGSFMKSYIKEGIISYSPNGLLASRKSSVFKNFNFSQGNYKLYVKALSFPEHSSSFNISMGDAEFKMGINNKESTKMGLDWHEVGRVTVRDNISSVRVDNLEDRPLYIDTLLVVPEKIFKSNKRDFIDIISGIKIVDLESLDDLKNKHLSSSELDVFSYDVSGMSNICTIPNYIVNYYKAGAKCGNPRHFLHDYPNISKHIPTAVIGLHLMYLIIPPFIFKFT